MSKNSLLKFVVLVALSLIMPRLVPAGHLPTKSYTTFDGLANDSVNKIVRDSRGFLWFCTEEGLSRFDGFQFENYSQTDGLPHRNINDLLETSDGDLLLATTNGLAVFDPNGVAYKWNVLTGQLQQASSEPPMFRTFFTPNPTDDPKKRSVLTLTQSPEGKIFAGTGTALYQLTRSGDAWTWHQVESPLFPDNTVFANLKFDRSGYLWILASSGIFRMAPDGGVVKIDGDGGGALLMDDQGQIWVGGSGTDSGLRLFTLSADAVSARLSRVYQKKDGLPAEHGMSEIRQTSKGRILIIVGETLCEFLPEAAETDIKFRVIARGRFQALAEDGGGSLWLGTLEEGAWKISPTGFIKFDVSDGIPEEGINSLITDQSGELFLTSFRQKTSRFTGGRFETIVPMGLESRNWGNTLLDHKSIDGEWWIPSTNGLLRYPKLKSFNDLAHTPPKKIYTTADGLFSNLVDNIFEDSRGDIWIGTTNTGDSVHRWDRKSGTIVRYTSSDGLPTSNGVVSYAEDTDHNVWMGFYFGGLARYKNGKFQFFDGKNGIPPGSVSSIFQDSKGRMWVATKSRGIFYTDDATAASPTFTDISTADGLSSNQVNCIAEDSFGQIFVGTGSGVDRINRANGNIKLYTQADGLPGSVVSLCRMDSSGSLWFVSRKSLVKYVPQAENPLAAPIVYIGAVSVDGTPQKISKLGVENVPEMQLAADQNQLKIDFFALGFGTGDRLHFQYRLDDQAWSASDDQKSVTFNLDAGDYRFAVRAVNADGVYSERSATVSFSIARPIYRRWWFIVLALLIVGGIVISIERYRSARLIELKSAFGKLSVSEQRFRRMIEQSSLGFVIFSPDGRLLSVNSAYENFWNVTFDQIRDWKMLEDEQLTKAGVVAKLRRVFNGENVFIPPVAYDPQGNSAGVEVEAAAKPRWIQSFAYPVKTDAGELLEVIMVMEDVTEIKNSEAKLQYASEERLRELEQVRRRIAADLHDDIGSSLTQISIYSEVLQQRIDKSNQRVMEPLEFIASSSRELVDAMSDIVWAINPQKDFLSELSGKMRRLAADLFSVRNIEFTYDASPTENIPLGANIRREVFLIFKEAVNNIIKHSACSFVEIELKIENSEILLRLHDNGHGFALTDDGGGHGLVSMKQRATGLGGTLDIASSATSGTTVTLVVSFGAMPQGFTGA